MSKHTTVRQLRHLLIAKGIPRCLALRVPLRVRASHLNSGDLKDHEELECLGTSPLTHVYMHCRLRGEFSNSIAERTACLSRNGDTGFQVEAIVCPLHRMESTLATAVVPHITTSAASLATSRVRQTLAVQRASPMPLISRVSALDVGWPRRSHYRQTAPFRDLRLLAQVHPTLQARHSMTSCRCACKDPPLRVWTKIPFWTC